MARCTIEFPRIDISSNYLLVPQSSPIKAVQIKGEILSSLPLRKRHSITTFKSRLPNKKSCLFCAQSLKFLNVKALILAPSFSFTIGSAGIEVFFLPKNLSVSVVIAER